MIKGTNSRIGKAAAVFGVAVLLTVGAVQAQAAVLYNVLDLGTLGGASSQAFAISSNGLVTGISDTAGGFSAFRYSGSGPMTAVNAGGNSQGFGINASGQVVGALASGDGFLNTNGVNTSFNAVFGSSTSSANAINNAGQVAGYFTVGGLTSGFVYSGPGNSQQFGLGDLSATTQALSISANGAWVAGGAEDENGQFHAFLFDRSNPIPTVIDLGIPANFDFSTGYGVNNAGLVVGELGNGAASTPFLYNDNGGYSILTTLAGGGGSAYGINQDGTIVGTSAGKAVIYSLSSVVDLNTIVELAGTGLASLASAQAINDLGEIVGYGIDASGNFHAFKATPVPLPAAAWLLGTGIIGLVTMRRIKPRKED